MGLELWTFSRALGCDAAELRGMSVEALDGSIGKVNDVVEEMSGSYLMVDMGPWIFGRTVALPAGLVTSVDTSQESVFIDRTKDDVKDAPDHDPRSEEGAAAHDALTAYYSAGRGDAFASVTPPVFDADAPVAGVPEAGSSATAFGRGDEVSSTPPALGSTDEVSSTPPAFGSTDEVSSTPPAFGSTDEVSSTPPAFGSTD